MSAWPAALPHPVMVGAQVTPADAAARTDFEQGPPRVRARFRQPPERYTVELVLTPLHMEIFRAWYRLELVAGARVFDVPLAFDRGERDVRAQFAGPYQARFEGWRGQGKWTVTAEWWVFDASTMSAAELAPYL